MLMASAQTTMSGVAASMCGCDQWGCSDRMYDFGRNSSC